MRPAKRSGRAGGLTRSRSRIPDLLGQKVLRSRHLLHGADPRIHHGIELRTLLAGFNRPLKLVVPAFPSEDRPDHSVRLPAGELIIVIAVVSIAMESRAHAGDVGADRCIVNRD